MLLRSLILVLSLTSLISSKEIILTGKPSDKSVMEAVAREINSREDTLITCTVNAHASPSTSMQMFYAGTATKLSQVSVQIVDSICKVVEANRATPKSSNGLIGFALICLLLFAVPIMMIRKMRKNTIPQQDDFKI